MNQSICYIFSCLGKTASSHISRPGLCLCRDFSAESFSCIKHLHSFTLHSVRYTALLSLREVRRHRKLWLLSYSIFRVLQELLNGPFLLSCPVAASSNAQHFFNHFQGQFSHSWPWGLCIVPTFVIAFLYLNGVSDLWLWAPLTLYRKLLEPF